MAYRLGYVRKAVYPQAFHCRGIEIGEERDGLPVVAGITDVDVDVREAALFQGQIPCVGQFKQSVVGEACHELLLFRRVQEMACRKAGAKQYACDVFHSLFLLYFLIKIVVGYWITYAIQF